jgi:hypothetical protein
MRGRASELATLERVLLSTRPSRLALVGPGGSGKSVLAAALGHRVQRAFGGRVHWVRIGAWDFRTCIELLALRFGLSGERRDAIRRLRSYFSSDERLIVLDNHENDSVTARLLDTFGATKTSFVLTARRCLLGGVLVFPVTAPLVTVGRAAFPRVKQLTRMLRWNPLALDVADAIVASGLASVEALRRDLLARGVERVRPLEHEDDVPEVALLVDWCWRRLPSASRRVLALLAHVDGDHVDLASIAKLARLGSTARAALRPLLRLHLIQEHFHGRFALHAVVKHAVRKRTKFSAERLFEHYVSLLERDPTRLVWEQTHLFAAMDHAHHTCDMRRMLRVDALLLALAQAGRTSSASPSGR